MSFFQRIWGDKDPSEGEPAAIFQLAMSQRLAEVLRREEGQPVAILPEAETQLTQADSALQPHAAVAGKNPDRGPETARPSSVKRPSKPGPSTRPSIAPDATAVAIEPPPGWRQVPGGELNKAPAGLVDASAAIPEKLAFQAHAAHAGAEQPFVGSARSLPAQLQLVDAGVAAATDSIHVATKEAVAQLRATQGELEAHFHDKQTQTVSAACEQIRLSWHSGIEEAKKELAALAEASRQSFAQTRADEYRAHAAQALQELDERARKSAEAAANSIRLAFNQALAELHSAQETMRAGLQNVYADNKKQLAQLSAEIVKMQNGLPALVDRRLADATQEFRKQLREMATESLTSTVRAIEAEHKETLAKQEEALQRRIDEFLNAKLHQRSRVVAQRARGPQLTDVWRGLKLGLSFAFIILVGTAVFLSMRPQVRLRGDVPVGFVEDRPEWNAKRRAQEQQLARAYWQSALRDVQWRYRFGAKMPADPPPEFQANDTTSSGSNGKVDAAARVRYWQKVRELWHAPDAWEQYSHWNVDWIRRALDWVDGKTSQYLAGFG